MAITTRDLRLNSDSYYESLGTKAVKLLITEEQLTTALAAVVWDYDDRMVDDPDTTQEQYDDAIAKYEKAWAYADAFRVKHTIEKNDGELKRINKLISSYVTKKYQLFFK